MNLPAIYFLIMYIIVAAFGIVMFIFNFFHVAKFGLQSPKTSYVLAGYTLAFMGILLMTLLVLAPYDWSEKIDFNNLLEANYAPEEPFL